MIVSSSFNSFSEEKKLLSLEDIGNLLRSNISKKRVVITIEENGVAFPKTKNNVENLRKLGADEAVLGVIEKEWKKDERILIVETDPSGAVIYLDEEKVGETPIEIEGLRPRKYSVKVEKEGFERVDHEISLTQGIGRKLTISLVRSRGETPSPASPRAFSSCAWTCSSRACSQPTSNGRSSPDVFRFCKYPASGSKDLH